jgi:hypothetical protein
MNEIGSTQATMRGKIESLQRLLHAHQLAMELAAEVERLAAESPHFWNGDLLHARQVVRHFVDAIEGAHHGVTGMGITDKGVTRKGISGGTRRGRKVPSS